MLYPGSGFRMSDEMLETYVRQLLQAHETPSVTVAWQGGEPTLMGLEFFRRSIACVEKHRRPGVTVEYSIQTNATLIDEAWAAFFKEHDFLVGISIDGPRAMHDVYRVDQGGRPTFDRVMRGLSALTAHGVEFNTLTTLHRANADRPAEVYRFLRDECGARFLQFIPIVERAAEADAARAEPIADRDGDAHAASRAAPRTSWRERPLYVQSGCEVTERSVTAEQYGRFLVAVFEEWVRRDVGTVYVQMFDVALANWNGEPPGLCVHCATCGTAPALEHNGDLYSCDHFVEPAFLLGNIAATPMTELLASPQQWRFGRNKLDGLPRHCLRCDVRFACHGGCPKDRFLVTGDDEPGLNYLCAGYQMFFRHVDAPMRFMSEALRRGRAPAEIMGVYADADRRLLARIAATGRNDPCPCGSGKKLKQCHGRASTERG